MKKKFLSIMAIFILGVVLFAGCGFNALIGGPNATDLVKGNGGLFVQKGDYVYYVNGHQKVESLKEGDNKYGSVEFASLCRAKVDADGKLICDEDGNVEYDVLAPKVVGTEYANFYIYGDKIYYASPNTEKDSTGKIEFKQTDFYYSNLDGTNVKRIYKTIVGSSTLNFGFYLVEDKVVLAVYDSSDLLMIDVESKELIKVATGVSKVVLPKTNGTDANLEANNLNVYYTRSAVDADLVTEGNVLAYATLKDKREYAYSLKNATYQVLDYQQGTLIYSKKTTMDNSAYYFSAPVENNTVKVGESTQLTFQAFDKLFVMDFENGNYRGLLTTNASGYITLIKPSTNLPEFEVLDSENKLSVAKLYGNTIFAYNDKNELFMLSYDTLQAKYVTKKLTDSTNTVLYFNVESKLDFDGTYVYAFQEFKGDSDTGYYMVRINTLLEEIENPQVMSKIQKNHIKTEETPE